MPRRRPARLHFAVTNLTVPLAWRVGRTTLHPPGHLLARLDARLGEIHPPLPEFLVDDYRQELRSLVWSTISVPVPPSDGRLDELAIDRARDIARDTIAVLRLFQRSRARYISLERQTFGLAADFGSVVETRWATDRRGRWAGGGWTHHGILAPWAFRSADLRAFRTDPRFAYINAALVSANDDWRGRVIAAVRTMSAATVMQRASTRIVLLGTALEALLGDPFVAGHRGVGGHRLAKRAAYLWCGTDMPSPSPHRPVGRPACLFLTAGTDPRGDPSVYDKLSGNWACSWYGIMRHLYDDRNAVLHGGVAALDQKRASAYQFNFDKVLLATIDWILQRQPVSVADLDFDIAALPVA
jgi:hypothetical protein